MASSCAFHRSSATWQALVSILISVAAVHLADAEGQDPCPHFYCGGLHNISTPFRRQGDPPSCGVKAYELVCSSSKATIRINTGTYFVTSINYTGRSFWVVDTNLNMHNRCLFPRGYQPPSDRIVGSHIFSDLEPAAYSSACFVNCSQAVTNNSGYKPVTCLSTNSSFVYVSVQNYYFGCHVFSLEPSCGYLAMIPLGSFYYPTDLQLNNASYVEIVQFVKEGFSLLFPIGRTTRSLYTVARQCLTQTNRPDKGSTELPYPYTPGDFSYFHEHISRASPLNWTIAFFWSEINFARCVWYNYDGEINFARRLRADYPADYPAGYWVIEVISYGIGATKLYAGICRFILFPLVAYAFLAHKYWKTRITIDAVEKFLRMQEMIGPTRYAYTNVIAITSHFRDKLGQGGFGCVYKGVLHPCDVHVAVKMLDNSNCNGDEFISEVSTIGRIHHINVVRLVGFCAEETRRALIYEYMPHSSLDKYIFSSERSFSWDKLTEIALGIARGINYLHQGCDMQILHFDIKPHNILLDSNFVPKVADFGLAKLYPRDKSLVPASGLRGTIGYIAPEMISRSFGVISSKSDVYSFGMLLLEMAGGRRNADQNATTSSQVYYPSWVYDRLAEQEAGESEISAAADMHELERKLCIVGLRCIQMKPHDRPTMSEVIEMLECGAGVLQMPSRPFFCDDEHIVVSDSCFPSELTAISEEDG